PNKRPTSIASQDGFSADLSRRDSCSYLTLCKVFGPTRRAPTRRYARNLRSAGPPSPQRRTGISVHASVLCTWSILPSCAPAVWMSDRCSRPARSPAAPLGPSRDGCGWASRLPAGAVGVWEWLPGHLQVLAPPEPFEVPGDEVLDPLQAFPGGGFGAHRQHARAGVHGAPAPAQVEGPVGVGPFGGLDVRAPLRPACVAQGFVVDAGGVLAELDEVPAGLAGRDAGFGGRHGSSWWRGRRARPAGCGLRGRGATSSTGRGPRRGRAAAASG